MAHQRQNSLKPEDEPNALRSPLEKQRRLALLNEPHIALSSTKAPRSKERGARVFLLRLLPRLLDSFQCPRQSFFRVT